MKLEDLEERDYANEREEQEREERMERLEEIVTEMKRRRAEIETTRREKIIRLSVGSFIELSGFFCLSLLFGWQLPAILIAMALSGNLFNSRR